MLFICLFSLRFAGSQSLLSTLQLPRQFVGIKIYGCNYLENFTESFPFWFCAAEEMLFFR